MITQFLLEKKMYCDMQTARCYNVFLTSCAHQTSVLNVKLEHGVRLVKIWFVAIPSYHNYCLPVKKSSSVAYLLVPLKSVNKKY